jgi:PPOX class probable F420-dependent enzyme
MAHDMSRTEAFEFIASEPPHTAKLATVRKNGQPHVAPVWVALDGEEIVFTTAADTLKGRSIRRDPRVALSFDDERPPFSFVVVEGVARTDTDLDELLRWATILGGRYMGDDRADEYGRRNAVEGELLVRVTPSRVTGVADIAG